MDPDLKIFMENVFLALDSVEHVRNPGFYMKRLANIRGAYMRMVSRETDPSPSSDQTSTR